MKTLGHQWRSWSSLAWAIPVAVGLVLFLAWAFGFRALGWDELEFARATRWVAHGRVPFRDFWEHHAPLQWFLLAPWARLGPDAGTGAVLWLRAGMLPAWLLAFWAGQALLARHRIASQARYLAVALPLLCPFFTLWAVEFRPDSLGTAFLVCALALWRLGRGRLRAFASGLALAAAVLANLRMAVPAAGLLVLFAAIRPAGRRWGFNRRAPWAALGFGAAFLAWGLQLAATGSFMTAWNALFRQNSWFNHYLHTQPPVTTFRSALLAPFTGLDPVGMILLLAAAWSFANLARRPARPGLGTLLALVQALQLLSIAQLGIHYPYHFQGVFLMGAWQAAILAMRWPAGRTPILRGAFLGLAAFAVLHLWQASTREDLRAQGRVMADLSRWTRPEERVLDAVGFALDREPAYPLWFMPSLGRALMREGRVAPYRAEGFLAHPPAAIVMTDRMLHWLVEWPELQPLIGRLYVPADPFLLLPGMSARLDATYPAAQWQVPRTGTYQVVASGILANHPWLHKPFDYFLAQGATHASLRVDPAQAPPPPPLAWTLDGHPLAPSGTLSLTQGAHLRVQSASGTPVGVFLLPVDLPARFSNPLPGSTMDTDLYQIWKPE